MSDKKTLEWEERAKDFLNEYVAQIKERNARTEAMFSDTDYINWLIYFTNRNGNFSDDAWIYFPEKLDPKDKPYVDNFNLFYSGIEKYASLNYIYPEYTDHGNFYRIKYNNIGFKIGIESGQGTYCYCVREVISDEIKYIDLDDIINNKKQENVDDINNSLNEFSDLIKSLYNSGAPIEAIITTFNTTIKELNKVKVKSL